MIIQRQSQHNVNATQDGPIMMHTIETGVFNPQKRLYLYPKINAINNFVPLYCRDCTIEGGEVDPYQQVEIEKKIYSEYSHFPRDRYEDDNKFRRRVSFDTEVYMATIIHHRNYAGEEIERCWYSKAEVFRIRQENEATVNLMRRGKLREDDNDTSKQQHCARGLEHCMPQRAMIRRNHKRRAWWEVFHQQDLQYFQGFRDSEAIARRYILASQYCAFLAHTSGLMGASYIFNSGYLTTKMATTSSRNHSPSIQAIKYEKRIVQRSSTTRYLPQRIISGRIETTATENTTAAVATKKKRNLQHLSRIHYPPLTRNTFIPSFLG